jgi:protein-L-isoaspartate(D-aspartate) O-methyltransferase
MPRLARRLFMIDFAQARRMMVDCQIRTFDVTDLAVLDGFYTVPREAFLPVEKGSLAYSDKPIVVGEGRGRTMLAPMILARMIQLAEVRPGSRVLDVGGAAGYGPAILAEMGAEVVALETKQDFDGVTRQPLQDRPGSVSMVSGPLEAGHAGGAPYEVILVEGAVQGSPDTLLAQLADGGRLVCIDGDSRPGRVSIFVKSGAHHGKRTVFDASAPVLDGFQRAEAFVF